MEGETRASKRWTAGMALEVRRGGEKRRGGGPRERRCQCDDVVIATPADAVDVLEW